MSGNCGNKPPVLRLTRRTVYQVVNLVWNDRNKCAGAPTQRRLRWNFYRKGNLIYQTAFGATGASLPIGNGSTYLYLNATPAEISAYLVAQMVSISQGEVLTIRVQAVNCDAEYGLSNPLLFQASIPVSACDCVYNRTEVTGLTGNSASLPGSLNGTNGILAFKNGVLNYGGLNFTGNALESTDQVQFVTIENCTTALTISSVVTGITGGSVPIPSAFLPLSSTQYMVFRNGLLQRTIAVLAGNIVLEGNLSVAEDEWLFVALNTNPALGCVFGKITIGANISGATAMLPSTYSASNQNKWLLFRNGVLQHPGNAYTVSGSMLSFVDALVGDELWIQTIK